MLLYVPRYANYRAVFWKQQVATSLRVIYCACCLGALLYMDALHSEIPGQINVDTC